ncbi:MAG: metallopeptidase TldD-related protein [Actinomycetota bacterium]
MPAGAVPQRQRVEHIAGGCALTDIHDVVERALALSKADACIVIASRDTQANVRWANNTTTTNGVSESSTLAVVSIMDKRVGSVARNYFPDEELESIVRASEAACEGKPQASDYMALLEGGSTPPDWAAEPARTDIGVFDRFTPELANVFERARADGVLTFGYAEHTATTTWLGTSSGVRRRDDDARGKVEITGKSPDFSRSTWAGQGTRTFRDIDTAALYASIERKLGWMEKSVELPAGHYEALLEPSCVADLGLGAYIVATARDADEGRSVYSKPGGGNRIGERMFGNLSLYSDPAEPGLETSPFATALGSGSYSSVFDNGLDVSRTDWVSEGVLRNLITPRYWQEKTKAARAVPFIDNLVIGGDGESLDAMIAATKRALLVTCFWYIRTVDPQTARETGLTRDGVFLVEDGEVRGAVNNFRWNMSPVAAFAQAVEIGRSAPTLPREWDEFLLAKAPPMRIENFNMSSVSQAT